jgi:hypothetical protein
MEMKTNTKTLTKGDIPKFCDRENTPISLKFHKSNKLRPSSWDPQIISNKKTITNNTNINNTIIYIELMYNILIIYLILYLLSYLKWYEQMYIVIYDYIFRAFYGFIDLKQENDKLILLEKTLYITFKSGEKFNELDNLLMKLKLDKEQNNGKEDIKIFKNNKNNKNNNNNYNEYSDYFIKLLNEKMIFITGNITYVNSAIDNLFEFPYKNVKTNFIRIERFVEIFDPINEIWEPLILRGK